MTHSLKRAYALLEYGWSGPEVEPLCLDLEGPCWWDVESVRAFSVMGALIEARAWPDGWRLLEQVVAPAHAALDGFLAKVRPEQATPKLAVEFQGLCRASVAEVELECWLKDPLRTRSEVLRTLVEAIKRSRKMGERR